MDYNPASGPIVHFPGAGFPGTERTASTFQVVPVNASCRWRDNARYWEAVWMTPLICAWPQMQDEFPQGSVPRRLPECVCEIEVTNTELLDDDHLNQWQCLFQMFVSSDKHDRMRAIHRVPPELSADFAEANLTKRWTFAPAPKFFQLRLDFIYWTEPDFNEINVRGHVRQMRAGWQP